MLHSALRLTCFLLVALALQAPAEAQPLGFVTGQVLSDEGSPLVDAPVILPRMGMSATTDEDGRYSIGGIPPGTYSVEIQKHDGYCNQRFENVVVSSGKAARVDFWTESEHSHCGYLVIKHEPSLLWRDPFTSVISVPAGVYGDASFTFRR